MPQFAQRLLVPCILGFLISGLLHAQPPGPVDREKDSLSAYIRMKYGLEQELYNGFQYYKRFYKYRGDPFYPDDAFREGSVSIGRLTYEHLSLKYNCFLQFLVLEYTDYQGRYNQLHLNDAHIDSFRLGRDCYQKLALAGHEPLFYQVLSSGAVSCYIHWEKNIHGTSNDLQYSHEYTGPLGTYYVNYKGKIQPFHNRKSFLSVFPESMAVEIKRYLRVQRLPFKQASPGDLQRLLDQIHQWEATLTEL
jgi:hypothetical protein